MENFQQKKSESAESAEEKQVIEGIIGKYRKNFQDILPVGVNQEMTDMFLSEKDTWKWHLRPEYIKDEGEREKYLKERNQWG